MGNDIGKLNVGNDFGKMSKRDIDEILRYIACFIPPEYAKKLKHATSCHEKFRIHRQFTKFSPPKTDNPLPAKQRIDEDIKKQILEFTKSEFSAGRYEEAIHPLNELICDATPFSKEISQLFTKRSLAFFKMGLHEDCFKNISLTIQHKDPKHYGPAPVEDDLKDELDTLADEIEMEMRRIKLSYPANPKNPFIIDALELRKTEKCNLGIFTKIDLHIGDIVLIEKAFTWSLYDHQIYTRCTYCLRDNNKDLIPCLGCSKAMFCSIECQLKANDAFHDIECPIIQEAFDLCKNLFVIFTNMFRMVKLVIQVFKGDIKAMSTWYTDVKKFENFDPFSVDCGALFESMDKLDFARLLFLMRENYAFPDNEYTVYAGVLTVYEYLILKDKSIADFFDTDMEKDFLYEMLIDFMKILVSRSFYLESLVMTINDEDDDLDNFMDTELYVHGVGIFVFGNYFNHSCFPNATISTNGGEIVCTVISPVKAGEELTIAYDR